MQLGTQEVRGAEDEVEGFRTTNVDPYFTVTIPEYRFGRLHLINADLSNVLLVNIY